MLNCKDGSSSIWHQERETESGQRADHWQCIKDAINELCGPPTIKAGLGWGSQLGTGEPLPMSGEVGRGVGSWEGLVFSRRKRGLSLGRYHWDMFHSVTQSFPWFALRACEGLEEEYAYYYLNKCIAVCLLPRWRSGEKSTCQCRRHSRHGFNPWVGKIPWRGKWQATPVFLPGKSHGQRSLMGYSPWGCTESDKTEQLSTHTCTYDSMLMEKWAVI